MGYARPFQILSIALLASTLTSCVSVPKRNALPGELVNDAVVIELPEARHWGDEPPPWIGDWFDESRAEHRKQSPGVYGTRHTYLALSGGGANGAFTAGLLNGWTERGDRPEFTAVTGISAGALTAPFAFLGSDYDHVLRKVALEMSTEDIMEQRRKIQALRSDAASSTGPLQAFLEEHIDEALVARIAEEHRRGRVLSVATTNLDTMRPVIWRLGPIAASGHPDSVELIRKILLASASVPAVMPPVLVDVTAGGEHFDELHVDGGATSQVFLYPVGLPWDRVLTELNVQGTPSVYIVRNSRLDSEWEATKNRLFPILARSVSSLIRTQGLGDLYRMYLQTLRDGLDYNLAFIPADFDEKPKEAFDSAYMTALYERAYEMAKQGYPWHKVPPGFEAEPVRARDIPK